MTKEELAEDYIDEHSPSCKEFPKAPRGDLKQAFLAGFEAGKDMAEADIAAVAYQQGAERYKTRWHKVADGDYPPCERGSYTIDVWTDRGDVAYYSYDDACWVAEPSNTEIDTPEAWCELPKYTDEAQRGLRK